MTHTETLSAFVDGETVDLDRLALALEDAEARRALVDFARLRDTARSGPRELPASLQRLRSRSEVAVPLRWVTAAAVLALVFLTGLLTPNPWGRLASDGVQPPPEPVRVEKFQPGVDWHSGN